MLGASTLIATTLAVGTVLAASPAHATPSTPYNQCPAIGADASCALLIDQTNSGTTVLQDGTQGVYDGVEDTLIGVLNESSSPLSSLNLSSSASIPPFMFDGDGICSGGFSPFTKAPASTTVVADNGSAGCTYSDTNGYGGPDVTYTAISTDLSSGTVTFSPAIPAGKSTYFSLEGPITAQSITVGGAISVTGTPVTATEGQALTGTQVATFTEANDSTFPASQFTATIDWGDGSTPTTGTVGGPTGGPFTVSGSHTYTDEVSTPDTISVSVSDTTTSNSGSGTTTATVSDAALSAAACAAPSMSALAFNSSVATFTDGNPGATTADFKATINWGDGSTPTTGTVTGPTSGVFTVSGNHTYPNNGTFTSYAISVSVTDDGGSTTSTPQAGCSVVVGNGAFVISSRVATVNHTVNFWGAQWWKNNPLPGGSAPASFKGFAISPAIPSCGSTFMSTTGNSPPPPIGPLPSTIAVIVTSNVTQSGSIITGNIVHIVLVSTNPGYAPDPGHPGTGTVTSVVC